MHQLVAQITVFSLPSKDLFSDLGRPVRLNRQEIRILIPVSAGQILVVAVDRGAQVTVLSCLAEEAAGPLRRRRRFSLIQHLAPFLVG